jgi:hypothetical protein
VHDCVTHISPISRRSTYVRPTQAARPVPWDSLRRPHRRDRPAAQDAFPGRQAVIRATGRFGSVAADSSEDIPQPRSASFLPAAFAPADGAVVAIAMIVIVPMLAIAIVVIVAPLGGTR